jgi:hypothetical protein
MQCLSGCNLGNGSVHAEILTRYLEIFQVKTFNGVKIRNLRHLAHLVDSKYCFWVVIFFCSFDLQASLKVLSQPDLSCRN